MKIDMNKKDEVKTDMPKLEWISVAQKKLYTFLTNKNDVSQNDTLWNSITWQLTNIKAYYRTIQDTR